MAAPSATCAELSPSVIRKTPRLYERQPASLSQAANVKDDSVDRSATDRSVQRSPVVSRRRINPRQGESHPQHSYGHDKNPRGLQKTQAHENAIPRKYRYE